MNLLTIVLYLFAAYELCYAKKSTTISTTPTSTKVPVTEALIPKKTDELTTQTVLNSTEAVTENGSSTCGLDSTCTTLIETTTLDVTTEKPVKVKPTRKIPLKTSDKDNHFCTCNLKSKTCDINCCCDKECTNEDKYLFTHCMEEANIFYDTRYCDYMKYIYINNTQYEWQINNNGLFCIIKSNLPPSYTIQRKHPLHTVQEAEATKAAKYSWFQTHLDKEIKLENFYYGTPVWIFDQKKDLKKLQIPNKFSTESCIIQEDVLSFIDTETKCSRIEVEEDNPALNLQDYLKNVQVVIKSPLLNTTQVPKNYNCTTNVCIPLMGQICLSNFQNCTKVSNTSEIPKTKCTENLQSHTITCENLVKNLKYNFYHNGSSGFQKVELLAILDSLTFVTTTKSVNFQQKFSVQFLWYNETESFSSRRSGNPGYLIGSPILNGHLLNKGNSTNEIWEINRKSSIYSSNFYVLPENKDDLCMLDDEHYKMIEFGYNFLIKCNFKFSLHSQKLHATQLCQRIQKSIFHLWHFNENVSLVFGSFGNANQENIDDWLKPMFSRTPAEIINQTTGFYSKSNDTLYCSCLVFDLNMDVFHAKIDFKHLLNQEKILGVVYGFGNVQNVSFLHDKTKQSVFIDKVISSRVLFYDITTAKKRKYIEAPSFRITLPYDFFYPFVKVENDSRKVVSNYILLAYCVMLVNVLVLYLY